MAETPALPPHIVQLLQHLDNARRQEDVDRCQEEADQRREEELWRTEDERREAQRREESQQLLATVLQSPAAGNDITTVHVPTKDSKNYNILGPHHPPLLLPQPD